MPEFLLALVLVVTTLSCTAVLIRLFVNVDSPFWCAWRWARTGLTVRRETSDLDRRYAELVEDHRRTP